MYSKTVVIGRLGKDPELRFTPAGNPIVTFSVATDRQITEAGGRKIKEVTWFRISAWGRLAEICNDFLKKGKLVLVEGRLVPDVKTGNPRVWKDRDGIPQANFEIAADVVRFLSPKDESGESVKEPAMSGDEF